MATERPTRGLAHAWRTLAAGALALALALPVAAQRQAPEAAQPLQVEAAFLVNFLRYTQWPPPRDAVGPLVVCVVGPEEAAATVRAVASAAGGLQGRRIVVQRVAFPSGIDATSAGLRRTAGERLRDAHLVFVQAAADGATDDVLRALDGAPVLTVGDAPGFAGRGGMLGLVHADDHLAFEANPQAIRAAGVLVSAKVLKLARIRREAL